MAGMKVELNISNSIDLGDGRKRYNMAKTNFDVDDRYNLTKVVGYGAYGIVCGAVDTQSKSKNGKKVALKKCQQIFRDLGDCKRILREIKILKFLKQENLLSLRTVLEPREGKERFKDLYVVTELLDTDLNNIIKSKQEMEEDHYIYFIYQILRGLKYLHSANVMHRDLKPANILVNLNCDLKICDFGLARGYTEERDMQEMTDYVITRWYRPPELLLMCNTYTSAIDIWSCGCIFAELLNRKTLFQGKDYIAMLNMICNALGVPSEEDMGFLKDHEAVKYMNKLPAKEGKPMDELVPSLKGNPNGIDFMSKMLQFNPEKRASAAELLKHPYLESMHDPNDEPDAPTTLSWEFEQEELSEKQLRDIIWAEIEQCNKRRRSRSEK